MPVTPDFDITPQSRDEEIIKSIVDGTPYDEPAESRIEYRLIELKEAIETGGGSYAAAISVSLDTSTYVLTIQLLNKDGTAIGEAQTIDLPLESTVVSGSYDNQTKSLILTLVSGQTITIPIGDIVSGLQPTLVVGVNLDNTPVENSTNPITSGGVYAVVGDINSVLEEVL